MNEHEQFGHNSGAFSLSKHSLVVFNSKTIIKHFFHFLHHTPTPKHQNTIHQHLKQNNVSISQSGKSRKISKSPVIN